MSMVGDIEDLCRDHRLYRLTGAGHQARKMYLSRPVRQLFTQQWTSEADAARFWALQADLEKFVDGGLLSFPEIHRRNKSAYFAALDPLSSGIWEIRSVNPRPALRVLGYFVEVDVFVALEAAERRLLGQFGSREWAEAIQRCEAEWHRLFPMRQPPLTGSSNLENYVSKGTFAI